MANLKAYKDYFESIAKAYKPIGHDPDNNIVRFGAFTPDEIYAKVREKSGLDFSEWCLTLVEPDMELVKNNSSQYRYLISGNFEVLIDPKRAKTEVSALKVKALGYCEEIVAYMIEQRSKNEFSLGILSDNNFSFYEQDTAYDKYVGYGVHFEYTVGFARTKVINVDNWI